MASHDSIVTRTRGTVFITTDDPDLPAMIAYERKVELAKLTACLDGIVRSEG